EGQESANDDNAKESYRALDEAVKRTYTARSSGESQFKQYNSYIRAIKWATLRIKDRGVIAYVCSGGWLDSKSADGMRKSIADEFSSIYVYNLRGNQRTHGERSRKEGGKIFGSGSRSTIAIIILVKNPEAESPAVIRYNEVEDALTREQKLHQVAESESISSLQYRDIRPNSYGDWIKQRDESFGD